MLSPPQPAQLFRSEYEQEMEQWLRSRFRLLCYAYLIYEALKLLVKFLQIGTGNFGVTLTHGLTAAVSLIIIVAFMRIGRWEHASRNEVVRAVTWLIVLLGGASFIGLIIVQVMLDGARPYLIWPLFLWHFTACLFLPWTPRESLRPLVPLLAAWAVAVVIERGITDWGTLFMIAFSPLILIPGLAVCAWRLHRHGREFHTRMVGKQFWSMRQEFQRARSIHESMFPKPHDDGSVRFDYTYSPMTEIGGDYIHLHVGDDGVAHLTLIDVTGHGLVAALTVNRLFGELERIRAESPDAEPDEVLTLLNRYFYLTLQRHMIYATAISIMLDPRTSTLKWCNAGHPPGYLRGVNGTVRELGATETILGALPPKEFNARQRELDLAPGDVVLAYTDGVFEARNRAGEQFGIGRLREMMSNRTSPRNWPQYVAAAVSKHTSGKTEDDVLIAALSFAQPRPRAEQEHATRRHESAEMS
jgi:hypothetical protein